MPNKKSWAEKLKEKPKDLPKIVVIKSSDKMAKTWGSGRMLIATPMMVKEVVDKIPKGELLTVNDVREKLAKGYKEKADTTCPMTTGIFLRFVAEAAEEDLQVRGKKNISPYWRVLKAGGKLNPKYPGGVVMQAERLKSECHKIAENRKGEPNKVVDFEGKIK